MKRALALAALALTVSAAPAQAKIQVVADAASDRGRITLYGISSTDISTATFGERVRGVDRELVTVDMPYWRDDPEEGPLTFQIVDDLVRWRCDRLARSFWISGARGDGTVETATYSVRTPSCRHRIVVDAPRRVRPGKPFVATLRDSFGIGDTSARVCLTGRCTRANFGVDQRVARVRLRARRRGVRTLKLVAPGQRLERSIAVGVRPGRAVGSGPVVLTTGDSLMQSVDAILGDRLEQSATLVSDVRVASSLSRSNIVDYPTLAREHVAEHAPTATAIFLGTNDFFPMTTPEGAEVACCGPPWIDEYERRARDLMLVYTQGGSAAVLWFAVPAMRDERRNPAGVAVNTALRRAASAIPTARVVPTDQLLTPDGIFRARLRGVRVREDDGIHLTIPGARIAVRAALAALRDTGVLG